MSYTRDEMLRMTPAERRAAFPDPPRTMKTSARKLIGACIVLAVMLGIAIGIAVLNPMAAPPKCVNYACNPYAPSNGG